MEVCVIAGPGNGQEIMDSLVAVPGVKVRAVRSPDDLGTCDVMVTPRGPSRSFSVWYREDPLGQAVLRHHQNGTPWVALCGSGLPLVARLGRGCDNVEPQSIIAAHGDNDRLFGQRDVNTTEGRRMPFHFTSAPSFKATDGTETIGTTDGEGSVLRENDLVLCSGLPLTQDGWMFLFDAIGYPLAGAKSS